MVGGVAAWPAVVGTVAPTVTAEAITCAAAKDVLLGLIGGPDQRDTTRPVTERPVNKLQGDRLEHQPKA
jgi:hypothetical protein